MCHSELGFTLIEIAVVLVIIGLLLGGVLKGQELLTGARVRSVIQQHDHFKAAFFGFMDRYRSPPGDYPAATVNIPGVSTVCATAGNGNGNALIEAASGEAILAWDHLSKSGFLNGTYSCSGNTVVDATTSPRNPYGQFLHLAYDDNYAGTTMLRHNLKTGSNIPSDILEGIDRKIDDGNALQGTFRGSTYSAGAATDPACWAANGVWSGQVVISNCGAALMF